MNPQELEHAAEQWLDEAIGHLRATSPRAGMETRVLAGLRARAQQRQHRWLVSLAGSAVAGLTALVVAGWPRTGPETTPAVAQQHSPAQTVSAPVPTNILASQSSQAHRHRAVKLQGREFQPESATQRVIAQPVAAAKKDVFPTPVPLTEQGRLLQAYLRQTPRDELALAAQRLRPRTEMEDLRIEPIEIKALAPSEERD